MRIKNTVILTILIMLIALNIVLFPQKLLAQPKNNGDWEGKKAIILVLDAVTLEEINSSDTPNLDRIMEQGAVGQMNIRARSSLANRGSTYLSLGMGVRTLASTLGGRAYNKDEFISFSRVDDSKEKIQAKNLYTLYTDKPEPKGEIINIAIGDIKRAAFSVTPNNQVGLLGRTAREAGLTLGVVGNSDVIEPGREITMLVMDEKGVVPYGSVSSNLLEEDEKVLGGFKLNQEILLEETERILPRVDVLFIDYGDTVRVQESYRLAMDSVRIEQKVLAIERADAFLGKVMERVDESNTLFLVITPNPSKDMAREGNFGLTPVLAAGPNIEKGLLTSNTTRRAGIVTNFDFAPTLLNFFGVSTQGDFIGEPMRVITNGSAMEKIIQDQEIFLSLRKYRYLFHWFYIGVVGISLITMFAPQFIPKLKGLSKENKYLLGLTVLSIPITMLSVSIFNYYSIILDLIYVFGGALLIGLLARKIFKEVLIGIGTISITTSLLLLTDIFLGGNLMIISPLGSDAIAGGRFYGVGNDYMGVLLGSTLLGIFSFYQGLQIKKSTIVTVAIIFMLAVITSLSPLFGANVGGTLSALVITLIMLLKIFDKKLSLKKIVIVLVGVIGLIVLLASLDAIFNPNPTHAGKAIKSLISGGWSRFIEIIAVKLGQVLWNLLNAAWNYILLLEVIILVLLYKLKNYLIYKVNSVVPLLSKGFVVTLLGAVIIFGFNDTGTIAAALILIYVHIPLGIIFSEKYK